MAIIYEFLVRSNFHCVETEEREVAASCIYVKQESEKWRMLGRTRVIRIFRTKVCHR